MPNPSSRDSATTLSKSFTVKSPSVSNIFSATVSSKGVAAELPVFVLVLRSPFFTVPNSMKLLSSKSSNDFLNRLAVIFNLSAPGAP